MHASCQGNPSGHRFALLSRARLTIFTLVMGGGQDSDTNLPSMKVFVRCCSRRRYRGRLRCLARRRYRGRLRSLRYHTADNSWRSALGTSYLLRNSIEVLLYSECDKILMVHLRSIINDEFSMSLLPMRVPRHEGRIIEAISVSVRFPGFTIFTLFTLSCW